MLRTRRSDDFESFCRAREKRLLEMIEDAMGKSVHQDAAETAEASESDHPEVEAA